jgi:hypothetical protein
VVGFGDLSSGSRDDDFYGGGECGGLLLLLQDGGVGGRKAGLWGPRGSVEGEDGLQMVCFSFPGPSDLEIDGLIIYLWALGLQWKFRLLFEHNNLFPFFAFSFGNKYNSNSYMSTNFVDFMTKIDVVGVQVPVR